MFSLSLFKINLFIFTFSKLIIADFLFLHRSAPESEAVVRQLRESASETANASSTPFKPNILEISWRSSFLTSLYISLTRLDILLYIVYIAILLRESASETANASSTPFKPMYSHGVLPFSHFFIFL